DRGSRTEFRERLLEELEQVVGLEVLGDLRREQSAERSVRKRAQVAERIAFGGVEALRAADLDHLVIEIEAARADPLLAQQVQELAAAAADVEDVRRAREDREVGLEAGAD